MSYRVCLSVQAGINQIEDTHNWQAGQIHSEYPKMSGPVGEHIYQFLFITVLGHPVPNISIIQEPLASLGTNESLTGCYRSVHNNESDLSLMPIEYPIQDYNKINPVQVLYEGPLDIISMYKVEDKYSIIFADLLLSSFKSFSIDVWIALLVTCLVFSTLLLLQELLRSDKRKAYSALFETFAHMMQQDSTDYEDRSGRLISVNMTIGFFFILAFYLNLMSTELVVLTKPHVINNYRDVIKKENMTVGFFATLSDSYEFETAKQGSIQEEFWKKFSGNRMVVDFSKDILVGPRILNMIYRQDAVFILSSMLTGVLVETVCKFKDVVKDEGNMLGQTYSWISSDPEGKQHTMGLIMRQGLHTELIRKGKRRLKAMVEEGVFSKYISELQNRLHFGPMMEGKSSFSEVRKCMSKQIVFNNPKVETVSVMNFQVLILACLLLFVLSFVVLIIERFYKMINTTTVTRI